MMGLSLSLLLPLIIIPSKWSLSIFGTPPIDLSIVLPPINQKMALPQNAINSGSIINSSYSFWTVIYIGVVVSYFIGAAFKLILLCWNLLKIRYKIKRNITQREGKYLTFALGKEQYGLEILKVREIIGYMKITAVPQTPSHVKGVINLRGQVIPVIDLRAKFGMDTAEITEQTCIIVCEIQSGGRSFSIGTIVDNVEEVLDIAGENIEESPQFGSSVDTDFILGMGKIGDTVKILLDIDKVLAGDDFSGLGSDLEDVTDKDEQKKKKGI